MLRNDGVDLSGWSESPVDENVKVASLAHGFKAYALFKTAFKPFTYQHLLTEECHHSTHSFVIFLVDEEHQKWYALPYSRQGSSILRSIADESFSVAVAKTCMQTVTSQIETIRLQGNIRGIRLTYRDPQPVQSGKMVEQVKKIKLFPTVDGPLGFLGKRKHVLIGGQVRISGTLAWKNTMIALKKMQTACEGFDEEKY